MRTIFILMSGLSLVAACQQSAANTPKNSRAQAEMLCVQDGGFLVPSNKIFNCKLPSGRVVDVISHYN